jgi:hypothetical protein
VEPSQVCLDRLSNAWFAPSQQINRLADEEYWVALVSHELFRRKTLER